MMLAGAAALFLLAFGTAAEQPRPAERRAAEPRLVIREQIVIRVSRGPRTPTPAGATPVRWREGRGVECVDAGTIAGATMLGPTSVDLILRDNRRIRAHLEQRCPALDYYYGFYVVATEDGRICADRDFVRSRMGGQCRIDRFRSLRARPARRVP